MLNQKALQKIEDSEKKGSVMKLGDSNLTGEIFSGLFQNWETVAPKVQELYLQNNKIEKILVSQFKNLEILSLYNNPIDEIPTEILKLKKLKKLYIDENQLKNSLKTLLKLRNIEEISIWYEEGYCTITFQILSILAKPNLRKKIRWEILRLEKILEKKKEAKKYIDNLARIFFRLSIFIVLLLIIWFFLNKATFITQNWNEIEAFTFIVSLTLALSLTLLTLMLGVSFDKWVNNGVMEIFEKLTCFIVRFDYKEYIERQSELERNKAELDELESNLAAILK